MLTWVKHTMPLHWTASNEAGHACTIYPVCDGTFVLIVPNIKDQYFKIFELVRDEAERLFAEPAEPKALLTWSLPTVSTSDMAYGHLGEVHIFTIRWSNGIRFDSWISTNHSLYGPFETLEIAKARAEEVLRDWLKQAKLRPEE